MPDTADGIDFYTRVPNLGLTSLAGNAPGHEVRVMDLVLHKPRIREAVERAVREVQPDLVGLSAMTFQFDTLLRVAGRIRRLDPKIRLAAGGYHATMMARDLTRDGAPPLPLDFLVRGEAEATLGELADEMERPAPDYGRVAGLSWRRNGHWEHAEDRPLLDPARIALPDRGARLSEGFRAFHLPIDVAETSRGCPHDCKFCSITRMYGRTYRKFPVERVVADLRAVRRRGARAVFFVDDNITHDVEHFRSVCQAIVREGLNDLFYSAQLSAAGVARNPEMVADMESAGFRFVFVGFESMLPGDLKAMRKPTSPDTNRRAAALLKQHRMGIIAGLVAGYPDDTRETLTENFRRMRSLTPDLFFAQFLTPYPRTPLREELMEAGLVENPSDFRAYDGFNCNVRTRRLSRRRLYRWFKWEALKNSFHWPMIRSNALLRLARREMLKASARNIVWKLFSIATGRQRPQRLDV
jgi:radical SAM superfamily enzyme YgiQ (UPF0313 family)